MSVELTVVVALELTASGMPVRLQAVASASNENFSKAHMFGRTCAGTAEVSRIRLAECGLIDLFAEDVAVTCVPGEFFDHGEQGPSHADPALAGIVLSVVEVEAGRDHS